jgi:hypothetical protein
MNRAYGVVNKALYSCVVCKLSANSVDDMSDSVRLTLTHTLYVLRRHYVHMLIIDVLITCMLTSETHDHIHQVESPKLDLNLGAFSGLVVRYNALVNTKYITVDVIATATLQTLAQ